MAVLYRSTGVGLEPVGGPSSTPQPSSDELAEWQDLAALLDPDAYECIIGTSVSRTVPAGEMWYVVNAWYCQVIEGSGASWFHRHAHYKEAHPLTTGTTIITSATNAASLAYLCKPSLVTGSDARYTTDPRGLYYERLRRIKTLTMHQVGTTRTDNGTTDVAFPADFTDGLGLHTSAHDVAWLILEHSGAAGGMNTQNEISDSDPIRFAGATVFPFKRATFPNIAVRGATMPEGRATFTYLKLPADW